MSDNCCGCCGDLVTVSPETLSDLDAFLGPLLLLLAGIAIVIGC